MSLIGEINALNELLARFKVEPGQRDAQGRPVYVRPATTVYSDTGNFVRYRVETPGKNAKVTGLEEEINEVLSIARGSDVFVRFTRPIFCIEAPYPNPVPLPWSLAPRDLAPFEFVLGRDYNNGSASPVVRNLTDANSAHVLIVGMTGSGKSTTTLGALTSLTDSTPPGMLGLLVINPKPEQEPDVTKINGLPHLLRPVITDMQEGIDALGQVVEEMKRRKTEGWTQRLLVNVQELAEFADEAGAMVQTLTARLLQAGRGLGIHLIADTQKPLVSIVGSVNKANFPITWVGRVANSNDDMVAAPGWNLRAFLLPGRGSGYLVADGLVRRVQSHYLPNATLMPEVERIAQKWPDKAMMVLPEPAPAQDDVTALVAKVLEGVPIEALVRDGADVWGAQTRVVKELYGPQAKNAGSYRDTAIAVLERIRQGGAIEWATS